MRRRHAMKIKIFIPLFILYLLCACKSPVNPDWYAKSYFITFRKKGTVADASNNSPVSATVTLYKNWLILGSAQTDNKGQYVMDVGALWFANWTYTKLSLSFTATGYSGKGIDDSDPNHVRVTEEWQTIDVQLEPYRKLAGLR
jgi:hypothetical protein